MNQMINNRNEALMEALSKNKIDIRRIEALLKQGADPLAICKNKNDWKIRTAVEYILNQYEQNDFDNAPRVIQLFFDHGMEPEEGADPFLEPEKDPLFNVALVPNEAGLRMLKIFLDHGCSHDSVEKTVLCILDGLRSRAANDSFVPGHCWFNDALYHIKMIFLIASYPEYLEESELLQKLIACDANDKSVLARFREWDSLECFVIAVHSDDPGIIIEDTAISIKEVGSSNTLWSVTICWKDYPYRSSPADDYSSTLLDLLMQMPPDLKKIEGELKKGCPASEISRAAAEYVHNIHWPDEAPKKAKETDYSHPSAYLYPIMELLLKYGLDPNAVYDGMSMMEDLYWIGNNYAGADTLALLFEHGADPMLVTDRMGSNVFENISFEVSFAAIELYDRGIYDAIVHAWFVFLAYQGNRKMEYFSPLKVYPDASHREEYDLEPFKIEDLKNHRNYSFALTFKKKGWDLHIVDTRTWWEVAKW